MELANNIYNYERFRNEGNQQEANLLETSILKELTGNEMTPLYLSLAQKFNWTVDESLVGTLKTKNEAELKSIDDKIEDATKNAGDTEVVDALFLKARYQAKIGDFTTAEQTYDEILSKPKTVTGRKIDANMEKARIAFFNLDNNKLKATITEAKRLNDIGGDWDRRNRLKIYEAHYLMNIRELNTAASLLLDCVATFSCTELCSYSQFMFYTLLLNVIYLDRNTLRKKIINDPHVITVIRELPNVQSLVSSIYNCNYKGFFESMLAVHQEMQSNRFTAPLSTYLIREYRVLAYSQFLEAYKSVMLSSMATAFGLSSVDLLDRELSRFIAAGRINAKIDKVGDIVETRRPDRKNSQYQEVIKKGDILLNQVQKLIRAIDV